MKYNFEIGLDEAWELMEYHQKVAASVPKDLYPQMTAERLIVWNISSCGLGMIGQDKIEIIGNIFENKDLLI